MPYVSPAAIVTGTTISKTTFGDVVKADLDYLANPPHCELWHSAAQSIATTAAWTAVAFNTEDADTATMHDTVTNNTRITIPNTGIYIVTLGWEWAANVTGRRGAGIRVNGSGAGGPTKGYAIKDASANAVSSEISRNIKLTAGQYIEAVAFQSSGGALNINSLSVERVPYFSATWIGLG